MSCECLSLQTIVQQIVQQVVSLKVSTLEKTSKDLFNTVHRTVMSERALIALKALCDLSSNF